jgi:UDP-N-acetylmuramoyl-tripeptide--D-alanyl-D-alanine ligase
VSDSLWTVDELISSTGGMLHGNVSQVLNGISIDSRTVAAGDIFVAIKGDSNDGHDYVAKALQAGAGLAIVSRTTAEMEAAGSLLVVKDDPLRALEAMGRRARARSGAGIIAVTGSVGKTSTKEMLRIALSASGETHASAASFNNHWGVPLTLARFSRKAAFGVFEIGMNHGGEITPLVGMVRPHVSIITTIAASHLGHFKSLDEIADAKAEIFTGVVPGGHAVINRDTPYFEHLSNAARACGITNITSFGERAESDARLLQVALKPDCCCITADLMGERVTYKLGMPGKHMAVNSLAVLVAAKLVGADLARAALALSEAKPAKGRGTQVRLQHPEGDVLMLDESYNANPASVAAALALLAQMKTGKGGRRIAVLGDMLELGEFGPDLHRGISKDIAAHDTDMLYAAGPLMQHLWDATPTAKRGAYAATSQALLPKILAGVRPGDCVMIKGSLGSRMGLIAEALRKAWPERTES